MKKRPFSPDTKTTSFSVDQSAGLQTQHDAAVPSATSSEINLLQDSKRAKVDATEQNVAEEAKVLSFLCCCILLIPFPPPVVVKVYCSYIESYLVLC